MPGLAGLADAQVEEKVGEAGIEREPSVQASKWNLPAKRGVFKTHSVSKWGILKTALQNRWGEGGRCGGKARETQQQNSPRAELQSPPASLAPLLGTSCRWWYEFFPGKIFELLAQLPLEMKKLLLLLLLSSFSNLLALLQWEQLQWRHEFSHLSAHHVSWIASKLSASCTHVCLPDVVTWPQVLDSATPQGPRLEGHSGPLDGARFAVWTRRTSCCTIHSFRWHCLSTHALSTTLRTIRALQRGFLSSRGLHRHYNYD